MNYFAHGHRFVDNPYFLAGTAVPDWLNVVDRRVRVRAPQARLFVGDADPQVAALARGIVQHHRDDRWFHDTAAFAQLSLALSRQVGQLMTEDNGFRCGFLGHLLIEVLLDAELIAAWPALLDAYYSALRAVEPHIVAAAVARMAQRPAGGLVDLIVGFSAERFLSDYANDAKLCVRLNQVMRRVKLPPLPGSFASLLPEARWQVRQKRAELLGQFAY